MPRETLNAKKFTAGLYTNVDEKDIPIDAGVYGTQNLDPNVNGKLKGAPLNIQHYSSSWFGRMFATIERNDGTTHDVVIANDVQTRVIQDFYGTPSSTVDSDASVTSKCIVVNQEAAHVGCGTGYQARWTGYVRHGQFVNSTNNNAVNNAVQHFDAECVNDFYDSAIAFDSGATAGQYGVSDITRTIGNGGYFKKNRSYYYHLTPIYDGFQEAPCVQVELPWSREWVHELLQSQVSAEYLTITVKVKTYTSLNRRITGFNVYRSESAPDLLAERGEWKLVKTIDINHTDWSDTTPDKTYAFADYGIVVGGAFEENSGFPETLESTAVKYTISCEANDYHFVGNCLHDNLTSDDGAHMIFRSLPYAYDTFNWAIDYLRLPFVPIAMATFNNKVYAFTTNKVARININGFFIEDVYEGAGCFSQQSVVTTEFGMFFANEQDCFWLKESSIEVITDRVRDKYRSKIANIVAVDIIAVGFDAQTQQAMFFISDAEYVDAWGLHLPTQRWDYYSNIYQDTFYGVMSGKDGELYTSDAQGGFVHYFGNTTLRAWIWISPEYDFDDPSQLKKFHIVDVDEVSTSQVTTTYGTDGAAPTTGITSLNNDQKKTIQIKLVGTATGEVDSMSIVYRRMIGKR